MAIQTLAKDFEDLLGKENVMTDEADRQSYSFDSAVLPPVTPAMVVFPTTQEQLGIVVKKLYEEGIPMTVRGAGTNLSGGTIPDSEKSVVISTQKLNRILEINVNDLYAVVEPGVITAAFAAEVAKKGLFYPPDLIFCFITLFRHPVYSYIFQSADFRGRLSCINLQKLLFADKWRFPGCPRSIHIVR